MTIKHQKTKTIACKENGRSADITTANFILGCGFNDKSYFKCSYCYVNRFGRDIVYINDNYEQILEQCDIWVNSQLFPKTANQVDSFYYFADIACTTDINLMWKHYDWIKVFDWFKNHNKLAATFATKYVNTNLLNYQSNGKIRVRMSLMPQKISNIIEPGTSPIINRIKFLEKLFKAGYSTHINLSPVIYYDNYLDDYKKLLQLINDNTSDEFKKQCGLEVIFLTYNENHHKQNLSLGIDDSLLWQPSLQEQKTSQYGGINLRYSYEFKKQLVSEFKKLVNNNLNIPIRYIF